MIAHGDCIEWLRTLPDGCADMVLTDPPYGTMACDWDKKVDMEALFSEMWRVLKHNGALLMFAQNPFAAKCIMLNKGTFRYESDNGEQTPERATRTMAQEVEDTLIAPQGDDILIL